MTKHARDCIPTGTKGLDDILLGGVTRGNTILIEGPAGTGKTTLGLSFIYAGAANHGEPGVIVSFELDQQKILRDAAGFNWDLQPLIDDGIVKIIQTSPAVLLNEFQSDDGVFSAELTAIGAQRLMIDGLTPLKLYAETKSLPLREDMLTLVEGLSRLDITALMTAERGELQTDRVEHERFVFDTVISLARHEHRRRVFRRLRVEKSRGQDFIGGDHAMRIEAGAGIIVYPRAQSRPKFDENQPTSSKRISTGIPRLDELMGGGLYEGSITMVTGISGTGKTVAGTQFLHHAVARDRRGALISLDEHPQQLMRNARTLGLDLQPLIDQGRLHIDYESPLELDLDVHFDRVVGLVERERIDCIVFDSIAVYETASPTEVADFLYALANFLKGRLATVLFNYESPELLGVSQISEELKGSHLVDNIVLLSYVEISTHLRRALTVPKVRGSRNIQQTREFVIGDGGITVLGEGESVSANVVTVPQLPFSAYYGLLSRSPTRHSPAIDEAIAHGEDLPDSTQQEEP